MSDQYLGEIRMFGFNFAPTGWQLCNGQTLPLQSYAALFALLGTTYGGNGTSTFQLPNFQSRVPIHQGAGAGLSTYVIGEAAGVENVTLLLNNLPAHTHAVNAGGPATTSAPSGAFPATGAKPDYYAASAGGVTMNAAMIAQAGGNVPHTNIQPYLTINFCIALVGIFPSRN